MYIENLLLISDGGGVFFSVVFFIMVVVQILKFKGFLPLEQESKVQYKKGTDFFYIKELLIFTTHIILIDGKVSEKETEYVNKFMFREYGKRKQKKFASIISGFIKNGYDLDSAVRGINNKCDMSSKLQLLHFLIKVSIVDGYLTDSESKALGEITRKLSLTYHQLNSILAMYNYNSEKAEREREQYKKQKKTNKPSKIKLALIILELDSSATDDEVKKAYRKLVSIHHPDKVLQLDAVQRNSSKNKFLKINEAYDLLKESRGFK